MMLLSYYLFMLCQISHRFQLWIFNAFISFTCTFFCTDPLLILQALRGMPHKMTLATVTTNDYSIDIINCQEHYIFLNLLYIVHYVVCITLLYHMLDGHSLHRIHAFMRSLDRSNLNIVLRHSYRLYICFLKSRMQNIFIRKVPHTGDA